MLLNQKKLNKQLEIIELWRQNGHKGTVQACTGFGKSYIGVLCIKRMNEIAPTQTTLIIVPTLYLQQQWMDLIKEHRLINVGVLVINTAVKVNRFCDLLILDEIHRYAADVFGLIFSKVSFKAILGLTATLKRADMRHFLLTTHAPVVCNISISEALREGYISPFLVYNLGIPMNEADKETYKEITKKYSYNFSFFNHDFHTAQACLTDQFMRGQIGKRFDLTEKQIHVKAINYMRAVQERKRFLYNTVSKIEMGVEVLKQFPVRAISFAETTDFADAITAKINSEKIIAVSYHSKIGVKSRKAAMASFKDETSSVRIISTAKALDEGFDIEGIELALITSGTSTQRQFIQRMGRSIRFAKDKVALIINLYIKGTQDERWARSRQKDTPNVYWIDSIDEIDYEAPEGKSNLEAKVVERFELTGSPTN